MCESEFLHKNLKFLSLRQCKIIRGFKFEFLFNTIPMENLQVLNLSQCNVFDKAVEALSKNAKIKYQNLTEIMLSAIKSGPEGIQFLRKLPAAKIVSIDLRSTNFDDETSLMLFSAEKNELLKTLQTLMVKDCLQLTTVGLEAMIDGLSGMNKVEIFKLRFNVTVEEAETLKKNEEDKKKKKLEDIEKEIQEIKQ